MPFTQVANESASMRSWLSGLEGILSERRDDSTALKCLGCRRYMMITRTGDRCVPPEACLGETLNLSVLFALFPPLALSPLVANLLGTHLRYAGCTYRPGWTTPAKLSSVLPQRCASASEDSESQVSIPLYAALAAPYSMSPSRSQDSSIVRLSLLPPPDSTTTADVVEVIGVVIVS